MFCKIKEFFQKDWTPTEKVLVVLCCVLIGVIKGFLLAPIKAGIQCGNGNGDYYFVGEDDEDECCAD